MTTEKPFNIQEYLEIGLRRKWYIIIPLVIGALASFGVYKYLPKVYKATTLILVQAQKVPEAYVRSTVTDVMSERMATLSQEILSRTRLEKVIQEFNLYSDLKGKPPLEDIVEIMRKAIEVKIQGGGGQNSFTVSYEGSEPKTVMMVTNELASLFIEENLKLRESRVEGTADFINKELQAMEEELKKKEQEVRHYKERNLGQLPQQMEANLRTLERLQQQLKSTNESVRGIEERNVITQNMIEETEKIGRFLTSTDSQNKGNFENQRIQNVANPRIAGDPLIAQLNLLKSELSTAQSKYTENHPDVINLKKKIEKIELKLKKQEEKQETAKTDRPQANTDIITTGTFPTAAPGPTTDQFLLQYNRQYNEALLEAKRLKDEQKSLKEQIGSYQRRVEDTPKREQELTMLTRDYDRLMANYQSLLDKKIQAQMAENLERKQQGEHFRILDPARLPEKPIKPDRNKILLMGAVIGLALGLGLTWLRESMDQSFHTVSEVESYLETPVIATIPNLKAEERKAA